MQKSASRVFVATAVLKVDGFDPSKVRVHPRYVPLEGLAWLHRADRPVLRSVVEFDRQLQRGGTSPVGGSQESGGGGDMGGDAGSQSFAARSIAAIRKRSPVGASPPGRSDGWITTKRKRASDDYAATASSSGFQSARSVTLFDDESDGDVGRASWASLRRGGRLARVSLSSRAPTFRVGSNPVSALGQSRGVRPACPYGVKCYRKNPEVRGGVQSRARGVNGTVTLLRWSSAQHLREFSHPPRPASVRQRHSSSHKSSYSNGSRAGTFRPAPVRSAASVYGACRPCLYYACHAVHSQWGAFFRRTHRLIHQHWGLRSVVWRHSWPWCQRRREGGAFRRHPRASQSLWEEDSDNDWCNTAQWEQCTHGQRSSGHLSLHRGRRFVVGVGAE